MGVEWSGTDPLSGLLARAPEELTKLTLCDKANFAGLADAEVAGFSLGMEVSPSEWLVWFEHCAPADTASFAVCAQLFSHALRGARWSIKHDGLKDDAAAEQAVAAILRMLEHARSGRAPLKQVLELVSSLEQFAPRDSVLQGLQRFTLLYPFGAESVEASLCELLRHWAFRNVETLVEKLLQHAKGGPLKGIVDAWRYPGESNLWHGDEAARTALASLLRHHVPANTSGNAVLYAILFGADELFPEHREEIARKLLNREDDIWCRAQGLVLLQRVLPEEALNTAENWLQNEDPARRGAAAAAWQALGRHTENRTTIAKRLRDLAMSLDEPAANRHAALDSLPFLEADDKPLSLEVFVSWTAEPNAIPERLEVWGRTLQRLGKNATKTPLTRLLSDAAAAREARGRALFALALLDPDDAIALVDEVMSGTQPLLGANELGLALVAAQRLQPSGVAAISACWRRLPGAPAAWIEEARWGNGHFDGHPEISCIEWIWLQTRGER